MILSGDAIRHLVSEGRIEIDPFDPSQLNPASYDLRLGKRCCVYDLDIENAVRGVAELDAKRHSSVIYVDIPQEGLVISPGRLYLLHTQERLHTKELVTVIDGKSSIGRLGLVVHLTAGYGDPGFDGQYTLEVTSVAHPVRIYAGMLFCQARFHRVEGELVDYRMRGNYTGKAAMGPIPSASWKQFG